jgi:DNA polymerase III epsilon subunit-like protein
LELLVPWLRAICDDAVIVAHNASFDRRFLPFLAHQPSICSLALARRTVPDAPNYKNQTLAAFFGVRDPALRGRRAHRALADVIVTRHVFFHCVDRYVAAGYPDDLDALAEFVTARIEHKRSA